VGGCQTGGAGSFPHTKRKVFGGTKIQEFDHFFLAIGQNLDPLRPLDDSDWEGIMEIIQKHCGTPKKIRHTKFIFTLRPSRSCIYFHHAVFTGNSVGTNAMELH